VHLFENTNQKKSCQARALQDFFYPSPSSPKSTKNILHPAFFTKQTRRVFSSKIKLFIFLQVKTSDFSEKKY